MQKELIKQVIKEIEIRNKFEKIKIEDPYINELIKKIYVDLGFNSLNNFDQYLKIRKLILKMLKKIY